MTERRWELYIQLKPVWNGKNLNLNLTDTQKLSNC